MFSTIQVLAVNDARSGNTNGRDWSMQSVEAVTIDRETGAFGKVGRLRLPKDLIGQVGPGMYTAGFSMERDEGKDGGGFLVARLVSLASFPPPAPAAAPAAADVAVPSGGTKAAPPAAEKVAK